MNLVIDSSEINIGEMNDIDIYNNGFIKKNKDPKVSYIFTQSIYSGKDAGLLSFDFECNSKKNLYENIILSWIPEGFNKNSEINIKFKVQNGKNIIPLSSYPSWYFIKHLKKFTLKFDGSRNSCNDFSIKNLEFSSRKNNFN